MFGCSAILKLIANRTVYSSRSNIEGQREIIFLPFLHSVLYTDSALLWVKILNKFILRKLKLMFAILKAVCYRSDTDALESTKLYSREIIFKTTIIYNE